ncbi:MAG: MOSC domain-containing protein [Croceitalea sp.]|nr:MOSC domain-containing protein [Croceitalea sp.]
MKILATNTGKATTLNWQGKSITTGIFKYPKAEGIYLHDDYVEDDIVSDLKVHGGKDKACYLFSANEYSFWKDKYPNLTWNWGMFGENLTIENLEEEYLKIGNTYKIGEAIVQVSQPREPCFKLGLRFGTQNIIQEFIQRGHSGTYVRILQPGSVKKGDKLVLIEESPNILTVKQLFDFLYASTKDLKTLELALQNEALPQAKKEKLKRFLK